MVWPCWLQQDLFRPPQGHYYGYVPAQSFIAKFPSLQHKKSVQQSPFIIVISKFLFYATPVPILRSQNKDKYKYNIQVFSPISHQITSNLHHNINRIVRISKVTMLELHDSPSIQLSSQTWSSSSRRRVEFHPQKNGVCPPSVFHLHLFAQVCVRTSKFNPLPIILYSSKSRNTHFSSVFNSDTTPDLTSLPSVTYFSFHHTSGLSLVHF